MKERSLEVFASFRITAAFFNEVLPVASNVQAFLQKNFPDGLWRHQGKAIKSVLAGLDTVITTKTSSGKSLVFTLPAVQKIFDDKNSCSLFLYPTKAVTNDQLNFVKKFLKSVGLAHIWAEKYDGSTAKDYRKTVRDNVQIVLTNPDMLHVGILNNHDRWKRFFSNLRIIAVDEAHEYRGIFGANVALLLRRVREVARMYGSEPTFVAASATAANAEEHLRNLSNLDLNIIKPDEDGSKQGRKTYFLCQPVGYNPIDAATRLTIKLVQEGTSVLTFCPSRTSAEKKFYAAIKMNPSLSGKMAIYRAGLRADFRNRSRR
jgi:DEAD/DEAH box helicase domain-containing protein